jgi:hypothetical protein
MEQTSPPATTYQETSGRYRATGDARERFEELTVRDVNCSPATTGIPRMRTGHYRRERPGSR